MKSNTKKWEDYYTLLGLSKGATMEEIEKAYKEKAQWYHPDRGGNEHLFKLLNDARQTLTDPIKRRLYDATYEEEKRKYTISTIGPEVTRHNPNQNPTLNRTKVNLLEKFKQHLKKYKVRYGAGAVLVVGIGSGILIGQHLGKRANNGTPATPNQTPNPDSSFAGINDALHGMAGTILDKFEIPSIPDVQPEQNNNNGGNTGNSSNGGNSSNSGNSGSSSNEGNSGNSSNNGSNAGSETPSTPEEPPIVAKDENEKKVERATETIYNDWAKFGSPYDKETIESLVRCLNKLDGGMDIEKADDIILDMVNRAATPGANNALAGDTLYKTGRLNLKDLLIRDQIGSDWVLNMQSHLNGANTDLENIIIYGERAFTDEAILLDKLNGYSIYDFDSSVMLLWSRLAIGTNGVIGTLGDNLKVDINGNTYTQDDLNDARLYESVIKEAKQEFGLNNRQL